MGKLKTFPFFSKNLLTNRPDHTIIKTEKRKGKVLIMKLFNEYVQEVAGYLRTMDKIEKETLEAWFILTVLDELKNHGRTQQNAAKIYQTIEKIKDGWTIF